MTIKNIAVLASGNGTNFQAIILGSDQGRKVYKKKLIDLIKR